jgi:hypothetical protein
MSDPCVIRRKVLWAGYVPKPEPPPPKPEPPKEPELKLLPHVFFCGVSFERINEVMCQIASKKAEKVLFVFNHMLKVSGGFSSVSFTPVGHTSFGEESKKRFDVICATNDIGMPLSSLKGLVKQCHAKHLFLRGDGLEGSCPIGFRDGQPSFDEGEIWDMIWVGKKDYKWLPGTKS